MRFPRLPTRGSDIPTALFLAFLVQRLCGAIDWPWYAVMAPLLVAWLAGFLPGPDRGGEER